MILFRFFVLFFSIFLCSGCGRKAYLSENHPQHLTQGNIQMNLAIGQTTKAQVLEKFGSPNIVTRDGSGFEVWTYQRSGQVSQSSSQGSFWSILLIGSSSDSSQSKNSSHMITLIIKFNDDDIVCDFRSRSSHF